MRAERHPPASDEVGVREAVAADLEGLNGIYNHYVRETHITFDVDPITISQRWEWFRHYATAGRYRVFVALAGSRVLGFASSSRWRPKHAYETSVESSVYLSPHEIGRGIGTALYAELFGALGAEDVHRVYAGIALPNPASIALHERFGFTRVALFSEQGRKFDRYWDVAWYEKRM